MTAQNSRMCNRLPCRLSFLAIAVASISGTLSFSAMANESDHIETIVVMGEKIDKDITDTTNAITVVNEESYISGEVKDVNELVKLVPNVITGGFGTINIRGVNGSGPSLGANAFMTNGNPRVLTSVDGVTESWGGYNFNPTNLWDVEQVEIMRGPQSTSQGANSIGGALVLKTKDPSQQWESAVRAGLENYDNGNMAYNQAVMVSGPIIEDELSFRLAVDRTDGETWLTYAEDSDELDGAPDLDDVERLNARGKLLWTPNQKAEVMLTVNHRENEGAYLNWVDIGSRDTLTLDTTWTEEDGKTNTRMQDSSVDTVSLDFNYKLSSSLSNDLQVSFNDYLASFDEYPGTTLLDITEKTYTLENRLLYVPSNSNLSGFVGIYASQADSTLDVNFGTTTDAYDGDTSKSSLAIFGEGSYALNDKLSVTTGLRLQQETQDRYLDAWDNILDEETDETVFLPKLELVYTLSEGRSIGASVRKGYNPGGNALDWSDWSYYSFDSETVIAYELSSKNVFANGNRVNANLFFNDYTDYQAYSSYRLYNVDSAYTYGLEVEGLAFVTDNLEVRGSIGTLQTEVTSSESDDWSGSDLPFAADWNLSAGFTQYIGERWSVGADATYVSEYYSDLENTDSTMAGDYYSIDTRIQYTVGDFTIDGYITNLTNQTIIYQMQDTEYAAGQTRTIGINATYRM